MTLKRKLGFCLYVHRKTNSEELFKVFIIIIIIIIVSSIDYC